MRPSARNQILDAAIRVTEREGITGLTMDSAATEAGVTKGGLLYHFHNREEMILAIQRHLCESWESQLLEELGKPLHESTATERAAAYVRFELSADSRPADLAFMTEAASDPALARIWEELMQRWVPMPTVDDPDQIDLLLARLAADGLWLLRVVSDTAPSAEVERAMRARVLSLIKENEQ